VVLGSSYTIGVAWLPFDATEEIVSVEFLMDGKHIGEGTSIMHMARAPGTFSVTGTATIAGKNGATRQQDCNAATVTHMFPEVASIIADAGVDGKMKAMWAEALSADHYGKGADGVEYKQELGAWVFFDTSTGRYEFWGKMEGPKVYGGARGTINPPFTPLDINQGSHSGGKYVVAFAHTHTPTKHSIHAREVGISDNDELKAKEIGVPAIAYDYVNTVTVNKGIPGIPAGHPIIAEMWAYGTKTITRREKINL
jgi:hypothetical protein